MYAWPSTYVCAYVCICTNTRTYVHTCVCILLGMYSHCSSLKPSESSGRYMSVAAHPEREQLACFFELHIALLFIYLCIYLWISTILRIHRFIVHIADWKSFQSTEKLSCFTSMHTPVLTHLSSVSMCLVWHL